MAGLKKVLVVWIEYQTSHNIPLSQSLIQTPAPALFSSVTAERGEETPGEKGEARRSGFMGLKEEAVFITEQRKGEE